MEPKASTICTITVLLIVAIMKSNFQVLPRIPVVPQVATQSDPTIADTVLIRNDIFKAFFYFNAQLELV
ncbi:hypothetical protein J6590_092600 [Homalodisca vitripennis]|nr:hypothetical protein J6590_092600 [Homalodisca vitripennis]